MGTAGKLSKADFGYSMPIDAPLYEPAPIYYRDITLMSYTYVTDADAAAALLPDALELPEIPIATLLFAQYPFSTVGAYNEVAQTIGCMYHGKPASFAVRLHVTNAMAMVAGREIGGFPKKMGDITMSTEGTMYSAHLSSPPGTELCSGVLAPIAPVAGATPATLNFLSLRVFPNPTGHGDPTVCQLIGTEWMLEAGEMWSGRGNFHFTGASDIDPYHKLPFVGELPAQVAKAIGLLPISLYRGAMSIKQVTVLADL